MCISIVWSPPLPPELRGRKISVLSNMHVLDL